MFILPLRPISQSSTDRRSSSSSLTNRTIHGLSLSETHALDGCPTLQARQSASTIDKEIHLEISFGPVDALIVSNRRATRSQRIAKRGSNRFSQVGAFLPCDSSAGSTWSDAGSEHCFVCVNVPNSYNDTRVHDESLDGSLASSGYVEQVLVVEVRRQRLRSKVG